MRETLPGHPIRFVRRRAHLSRGRRDWLGLRWLRVIKPLYARRGWAALIMFSLAGCGSRTTVDGEPGPPPPPECVLAADCENFGDACFPVTCREGACVAEPPVTCDDRDPCTLDRCDSITGACTHPPATLDLDGDGHRAPLAGFRAGEPGSCGDDCDDANRSAF